MGQLFFGATIFVLLFAGGCVNSVPFFDIDELEALEPLTRSGSNVETREELFDDDKVDVETGIHELIEPVFPPYNNPFFPNPMFSFSNIDFGFSSPLPWWSGRNVCVEEREDEKEDDDDDEALVEGNSKQPKNAIPKWLFTINSCVEKPHKYTCKKIYNRNGVRKMTTVTRQCCQGYARRRNPRFSDHCENFEVKSFNDAAVDMGGNEFMRSMKNNGLDEMLSSNVTIFLPTDDAFTKFSEMMFENNLVYIPMGSRRRRRATDQFGFTSKDLLKGHIVKGLNRIDDLDNEEVLQTELENSTIRINMYSTWPSSGKDTYYTANCVPLKKIDQIVENGVMHSVDRVLPPVTHNLMDIIRERSDMSVFKTVLEKTDLSKLLEGNKPVTVFAPTDKAFEKLDMNLRRKLKEGKGCAMSILKSHILDFTFCGETALAKPKPMAYNILGEALKFEQAKSDARQKNPSVTDILINGVARVIEGDVMGTNGVLHVVDVVLPTDSARSMSGLIKDKNLTIFKSLLELSGLENEFNDYDNATVFAPVDKSFENNKWAKALKENPEKLRNNAELKEYLRGHVILPKIKTCDLKEDLVKTAAGTDLRVNLYSTHSVFTNVMNRATVNCARLVRFDDESCGSVLHQVDKQLENPQDNLLQMIASNPDYSKFYEIVKEANFTSLLEDADESYTVFLPKNDVFAEFDIQIEPNDAKRFVKDHIVNDIVCCAGITPTNWPFVRTIEAVSGKHLKINRDRRPKVENAMITKCDVLATNGIVHEINDVIIMQKKSAQAPPNQSRYDILRDVFF